MPEQGVSIRPLRRRVICPHGHGKGHCTGPYIHVAVVAKKPPRTRLPDWRPHV